MRFQNYFEHNGKKYYTGTVMIVHNWEAKQKATFICYDTTRKMYIYRIRQCKCHMLADQFYNNIIEITDEVNKSVQMPEEEVIKDCRIDGLMFGWVWYIFLMVVSTIFNDRIGLWLIWSIVFFAYRKNKIEKEGHYVEW